MEDKDKKRGPNYTEKKKSTPKYAWPVSFDTESLKKKINSSSILKWFSRSLICLGIPEINSVPLTRHHHILLNYFRINPFLNFALRISKRS
ncbi:unnamed protein product [Callosobruchus maculatus]|uniref:Uncharacterized protein n=1 Tax=Callosobruchus maculatus TaxID=64391 RepID=A0A653BFZ5_CALMS|nr:unnamed protein product [Callosobruchus maculatus]